MEFLRFHPDVFFRKAQQIQILQALHVVILPVPAHRFQFFSIGDGTKETAKLHKDEIMVKTHSEKEGQALFPQICAAQAGMQLPVEISEEALEPVLDLHLADLKHLGIQYFQFHPGQDLLQGYVVLFVGHAEEPGVTAILGRLVFTDALRRQGVFAL